MKSQTIVERTSEREVVVTRTIRGPARLVFEAWTRPELFKQWWAPRSSGLSFASFEADIRVGGRYRFVFAPHNMEFTGRYLEVTPHSRLVWTSEESEAGESVSTATFEDRGGETLITVREVYPSKEALDAATAGGYWEAGTRETYDQLEAFVAERAARL